MLKVATVLLNCYLVFVCAPSFAGSKQAINGTDGTFNTGNTWTGDFGKTRNSVWPNESIEILDRAHQWLSQSPTETGSSKSVTRPMPAIWPLAAELTAMATAA